MAKKSKIANGFEKKTREITQIAQDYNNECYLTGHKYRLAAQMSESLEALEKEIAGHCANAVLFSKEAVEAQKLLKTEEKTTEMVTPTPQTTTTTEAQSVQPM